MRAGLFEQNGAKGMKKASSKQQGMVGNTGGISTVFERNDVVYGGDVEVEKIEGDVEQGVLFSE